MSGHINYRDSKLTRILKPSLSGNARMAVICCMSPSSRFVEETKSTLQFGQRAKLVKTNAIINEVIEDDLDLVAKLQLENEKAKEKNCKMEGKLREIESVVVEAMSDSSATKRELANLKKFIFSEKTRVLALTGVGDRQFGSYSTFFTDEQFIQLRCKHHGGSPVPSQETNSVSKDDFYIPRLHTKITTHTTGSLEKILSIALEFKAQQVKALRDELTGLKTNHERKASEDHRLSLNALSPMVNEAMNKFTFAYQDIDSYKTQSKQLESKLANANNLIASLERQVDELLSQKNDALVSADSVFDCNDV